MKRFTLLCLLMLLLLPASALANDYLFEAEKDIRAAVPEDRRVTILDFGTETDYTQPLPRLFWTYDFHTISSDFVLLEEFFFDTCAKGARGPAAQEFHHTLAAALTGAEKKHLNGLRAADAAHLNTTLTVDIPADYMLSGPEEGTPYNSRVYFVRVYGERGALNAEADPWIWGETETFTAEYTRPLIWVLYAVDLYVEPYGGIL